MSDAPARKLASTTPPALGRARAPRASPRTHRVIAIGGGKGGIGKSLVASRLAVELARRGERVVLVDADLGGANLHTCLGVDPPRRTLSDFVEHRVERLEDVVTPTGIPNLGLVSGALDQLDAANPKHAQKMRLLRNLRTIDADHAILDLGAGTHANVLDFFLVSDHGVLVLVPEPTAVENVYRFVKAAFWRRVRNIAALHGFDEELYALLGEGGLKSPVAVTGALAARDPEAGAVLARELDLFRPRLVVNQVRTPEDAQVGGAVVAAWRKFFGLSMEYLGHVDHDEGLWRAVRTRRPLVQAPDSSAARAFAHIADRLAELESGAPCREDNP